MSASSKKKLRKEQEAAQLTEKQLAEQKEAKKLKVYSITFTAVICVILVAALLIGAFSLVSSSGILPKTVKAATIGSHTLTSTELNYFYIDAVNKAYSDWQSQYGNMLSLGMAAAGLTPGKPLNTQQYPYEEGKTWADYFADQAVVSATNAYALYDAAVAAGHTLSEEAKTNIDMMVSMLSYYAAAEGYSTTQEYLKGNYGNGATIESYKAYMELTALGSEYATKVYDALTYTDEQIAKYNDEHTTDFNSYSYSQFYVDRDDFVLCTDPENKEHTHTAEEYAAALKVAEEHAKALVAAKPANSSALNTEIAKIEEYETLKLTCDTYTDRLYLQIKEDNVADLDTWLAQDGHKAGDITYLPVYTDEAKTAVDGYLVVLFTGVKDNTMNLVNVRHILVEVSDTAAEGAKTEAKAKLEKIQTEWLANGGTDEAFAALVKDNSAAPGSKENGGLYEDVYPGQMVTTFNDWCFAEGRKAGDYGIVETEHGYHLIYFVGNSETTFRDYMVENTLRNEEYNKWTADLVAKTPATVHTTKYLSMSLALNVTN